MSKTHPEKKISIALISGSTSLHPPSISSADLKERANLLWSLHRLGVEEMIALPHEIEIFQRASLQLGPPPLLGIDKLEDPLLKSLYQKQREQHLCDPLNEIGWRERIKFSLPPREPLMLERVALCFQDELIGARHALLIHYGAEHFEVSGYHSPISSISVPLGGVSALVITRLVDSEPDKLEGNQLLRTGIFQINAEGELLKGPWWPHLQSL